MINLKTLLVLMCSDVNVLDEKLPKAKEKSELQRIKVRELKDFCPYCKFNLKSGKDTCDECGKLFFGPA